MTVLKFEKKRTKMYCRTVAAFELNPVA